mgnify:CR=1 FL=1
MEKEALDFIVYCIFGDMSCPEDAIISRAYVDMAAHTMKGFDDYNEKWECRFKASELIKKSLYQLDEKDFDIWHKRLCESLISIYSSEKLSYGQAQKWINMTIKYVYVLRKLGALHETVFPFISDEHVSLFHPPVDSYILKDVLNDRSTSWSGMNDSQYDTIRDSLKTKDFDFIKELHEWNEISEAQKEYDSKSYARFLEKKKS